MPHCKLLTLSHALETATYRGNGPNTNEAVAAEAQWVKGSVARVLIIMDGDLCAD